jgi:hypothetical protein
LAATWAHGPASLPPSVQFWTRGTLIPLAFYRQALETLGVQPLLSPDGSGPISNEVLVTGLRADALRRWRTGPLNHTSCALRYRELLEQLRPIIDAVPDLLGERIASVLTAEDSVDCASDGALSGGAAWADTLLELVLCRLAPRVVGTEAADRLADASPGARGTEDTRYRDGLTLVASAMG